MLGSEMIRRRNVRDTLSGSSIADLKAISQGAAFCFRFRKLTVYRRYYGSEQETLAVFGDFPDSAIRYVVTRSEEKISVRFGNLDQLRSRGYIDTDKTFNISLRYKTTEKFEILEHVSGVKEVNVSMFSVTKDKEGTIVASMIFNPLGMDGDYYYMFAFSQPE